MANPNIGRELLNVPFGDMVHQLSGAIAWGQYQMDRSSIEIAKLMSKKDDENGIEIGTDKLSLVEAGFLPTFYQFTDTIIEVKIAITMAISKDISVAVKAKGGYGAYSATVNASYSSKYSYSVEGSSLIRTKISPVPPPEILVERIRALAGLNE